MAESGANRAAPRSKVHEMFHVKHTGLRSSGPFTRGICSRGIQRVDHPEPRSGSSVDHQRDRPRSSRDEIAGSGVRARAGAELLPIELLLDAVKGIVADLAAPPQG